MSVALEMEWSFCKFSDATNGTTRTCVPRMRVAKRASSPCCLPVVSPPLPHACAPSSPHVEGSLRRRQHAAACVALICPGHVVDCACVNQTCSYTDARGRNASRWYCNEVNGYGSRQLPLMPVPLGEARLP